MSPVVLVFACLIIGLLALLAGFVLGRASSRAVMKKAEERHQTLKRDYDIVSTVNVRLLSRINPQHDAASGQDDTERFLELYDNARRCLHRTLAQHNAAAERPIVIARDGGNLLQALGEIPELSFSEDFGEDAGVRAWMRRVFEMDAARRAAGTPPSSNSILALEREKSLWEPLSRQRAEPARSARQPPRSA